MKDKKTSEALKRQLRRDLIDVGDNTTTTSSILQLKKHNSLKLGYFTKEYKQIYYKQRTNIDQKIIDKLNENWITNRKDYAQINDKDRKSLEKYLMNQYNDDIDNRPDETNIRTFMKYQLEFLTDKYIDYKKKTSTGLNSFREKDFLRMIMSKISHDYSIQYKKKLVTNLLEEIDFHELTSSKRKIPKTFKKPLVNILNNDPLDNYFTNE